MSHTRLFNIWQMMLRRCENSRGHDVQNYQERGISVCREWHDFDEFMRWAITSGYRNDLTVDRINNNGNYCPANCRWADNYTQANNTRRNIWIEYNGEKKTVAQWARELGINYFCLHERWKKGWSAEQCLFGRDSA
jgi:hypothetical protein